MNYKAAWMAMGWVLACMVAQAAPREQRPAGDFDFYVLSLSWSPTFCLKTSTRRVMASNAFP